MGGAFSLVVSVTAAFALSACGGGDEFSPSSDAEKKALSMAKEKYPDTKFLGYDFMADKVLTKLEPCQIHKKGNDEIIYLYSKGKAKNEYGFVVVDLSKNAVLDKGMINYSCIAATVGR